MRSTRIALVLGLPAFLMVFIFLYDPSQAGQDSRYAYIFYATQDVYACSVAINIHLLQAVFNTQYRIFVFLSTDVSSRYRSLFQTLGASIIDEEPMPLHEDTIPYYRGCLLKLASFRMHEIDETVSRVLVLDADQLILHNLDHLFALPPRDFLAPNAYWIDSTFLSSTLMLIQPNRRQWYLAQQALLDPLPQQYDMDIINKLFGDSHRLPGRYVTVNSHWEDWNVPPWFNSTTSELRSSLFSAPASETDLDDLYKQAEVIHFFAIGKPWAYSVQEVKAMKPGGHRLLFDQWRTWRSLAFEICPEGTIVQV